MGSRHNSKIEMSKKKWKVEAQWNFMKCLYLLPYNRPSLELLLQIIDATVMRKLVRI